MLYRHEMEIVYVADNSSSNNVKQSLFNLRDEE